MKFKLSLLAAVAAIFVLLHVPAVHAAVFAVPHVALFAKLLTGGMAAAFAIDTNTQAVLIEYMDDTYAKTIIQKRPFFDRINKIDSSGLDTKVPLNIGYGGGTAGGQAGGFEIALANAMQGGAVHQAYQITPQVVFGISVLDNVQARFTNGPQSAVKALTDATQSCMEDAAQNLEYSIFGNGFGQLATATAVTNTSGALWTLTLTDISEAIRFNPCPPGQTTGGNIIVMSATTASALDAGTAAVVGVNQLGAQIMISVTGLTPIAGHIVGLQGMLQGSSILSGFPGILAYCPPIASRNAAGALTDTFQSVDRSVGGTGTGGWALNGIGKPITEGINTLCSLMANFATATPTSGYANPVTIGKVASELKTFVRYDMKSVMEADVFFSGVTVMTGAGAIDILAEAACPLKYVIITKESVWTFASPGNKPFAPSDLEGRLAIPSYDHNKTRFAITCQGYFYTNQPQATGVLTVA